MAPPNCLQDHTTCGKVDIWLPYGVEGVLHGEAYTWFEGAPNFATGSAYNKKYPTPLDNDGILPQRQKMEGDSKWNHGIP